MTQSKIRCAPEATGRHEIGFAALSQKFDGFKRKLMDPVGGKTGLFANVTKAGYELQGLLGQIESQSRVIIFSVEKNVEECRDGR